MRTIIQERVETTDMFDPKTLHRVNDPISSKVAAVKVKEFKHSHEAKIKLLLRLYNGSTTKQLEKWSKGTSLEITHTQANKRIKMMPDVERGTQIKEDGCCPLFLVGD